MGHFLLDYDPETQQLRRLRRARTFYEQHAHLFPSYGAFRKQLARRRSNGLLASGVVVESELGLLIDARQFESWLLRHSKDEAA